MVTEPQSWVLIGVFATIMLGGLTLSTNLIMRTVTASISGIEGRLAGRIDGLEGRIDGLDTKIESLRGEMNARFDAMGTRIHRAATGNDSGWHPSCLSRTLEE